MQAESLRQTLRDQHHLPNRERLATAMKMLYAAKVLDAEEYSNLWKFGLINDLLPEEEVLGSVALEDDPVPTAMKYLKDRQSRRKKITLEDAEAAFREAIRLSTRWESIERKGLGLLIDEFQVPSRRGKHLGGGIFDTDEFLEDGQARKH